ncbi:hypothetical protein NECAME_05035 [Necator americanus]|uniref:Resistance to inhibitors of cholinesterase protein 3 N-terminal domain-containing protein n=1 Tax=Necator americanus TaxID=51031 RepID=W2SMN3_NECAM|nr:hypothetical protein NECAME_05035 [Necator americanus]ETN69977.1 hypothetical protein NECAME_05035 [Necator americanus]
MPDRGRERERKRRRRRSDNDDDEQSGFAGWKLGLVVGVIVVCFAMLYPTVIHPMLMSFVGRKETQKPTPSRPPVHPGMGGPGTYRAPGGRADVHPAMRMAQQQAETQSGGRGTFTWMLPIYTVGVVIFLLYTLFKSKSKKKRRSRYDSSEYSSDDDDEYNDRLKKKIGKRKLRGLQERLQQTEEAMNKILEQLEAVQAVGSLVEGEQPTAAEGVPGDSAPKETINAKNEQYITDLEKALRDFKVLSDAYEEERGLRKRGSNTDGDTSTEELNSASDEDESEEEEGEEDLSRVKKKSSRKVRDGDSEDETLQKDGEKTQRKKRKEDDDEGEDDEPESTEETVKSTKKLETAKQTQSSTKNVRRRARKV